MDMNETFKNIVEPAIDNIIDSIDYETEKGLIGIPMHESQVIGHGRGRRVRPSPTPRRSLTIVYPDNTRKTITIYFNADKNTIDVCNVEYPNATSRLSIEQLDQESIEKAIKNYI